MKEITITINGSEITDRIFSESAYAALARAKSGIPERLTDIVQATEDDRSTINRFIIDSVNEAAGIISRYMSPCTVKNTEEESRNCVIYMWFTMSHNSPESTVASLKESIVSFSTARSLQQWMLLVKPDEANIHLSKAQNDLARIRELLSARIRPVKEETKGNNIVQL